MKKQATTPEELSKLRAENKRLKAKLATVESSNEQTKHVRTWWRSTLVIFLVGLAGALLVVENIAFWSARTVVETDKYVAVTSKLIEQPEIQQAIAKKTTDTAFANVDVEQIAQDALPPKAQFLVPTLTTQLQSYTEKAILGVVSNEKFHSVWTESNRTAHERFITAIRNYTGDGTINLNDVFQKASQNLADTKLSFLSGKSLPPKVGEITIVSASWLPKAHWLVVNLTLIRILTFSVFLGCLALALAVSRHRRRLLIRISIVLSAVMLAAIITFRVAREIAVGHVDPSYQDAARVAWTTILHGLFTQSLAIITALLLIAFAAWVLGGGRRAKLLRTKVDDVLAGKLHQSVFGDNENGFTLFLSNHKTIFRSAIIAIGVLSLSVGSLSSAMLFTTALFVVLGLLVFELLAAPSK